MGYSVVLVFIVFLPAEIYACASAYSAAWLLLLPRRTLYLEVLLPY